MGGGAMRVMLISPEWPGCGASHGIGASIATIARALAAGGDEVAAAVVCAAGRYRVVGGVAARVGDVARSALRRPRAHAAWLDGEIASWRPDVVELSNWGGLGAALTDPTPSVVRWSTPVAAIAPRDPLRRLARLLHARHEAATVRRARRAIANSRAMADLGRAVFGRDADAVIAHAWDGPIAAPVTEGEAALFVGRLERRKGVDVLARAWPRVRAARPAAQLHVVGADAEGFADALRRLAPQGVEVHGAIDDAALATLRRRCRVAVAPSRFESFGIVALEAWAAGQTLVAADAGGLGEIARAAAWLANPGDADALGDALIAAFADRARGAELTAVGRARLADEHAPARLASATRAVYAAAIAGTP